MSANYKIISVKATQSTATRLGDKLKSFVQKIRFHRELWKQNVDYPAMFRNAREMEIRDRISDVMLQSVGDEIYSEVLDILLKEFSSHFGFFGYINKEGDMVSPSMTKGVWGKCEVAGASNLFPHDKWSGLWGEALKRKETLVSNEILSPPKGHIEIKRAVCVPLIYQDRVIGEIVIANKAEPYTDKEVQLLTTLGRKLAPLIDAYVRRDQQEEQIEKLVNDLTDKAYFLQQLLASLPIPVFAKGTDYRYSFLNQKFTEFLGLPLKKMLGKTAEEIARRPMDGKIFRENDKKVFADPNKVQKYAIEMKAAEGIRSVVFGKAAFRDHRGEVAGLIGTVIDLTEMYQIQKALQVSETRYRDIVENMDALVCISSSDGTISFANKAYFNFYGISESELSRVNVFDGLAESQTKKARQNFSKLSVNNPVITTVYAYRDKSGNRVWQRWINVGVFDESGKLQEIQSVCFDISELEETRLRVQEAKDEAEAANAMKSSILANVAHDLKSPVESILGILQRLLPKYSGLEGDPLTGELKTIAEYINNLSTGLLNQSVIDRGKVHLQIEPVPIESLVDHLKKLTFEKVKTKNIQITFKQLLKEATLECDKFKILESIANIIFNAIKFSPEKGKISVEFNNKENKQIEICVRDEGPGIPSEKLESIFAAFVQVKEEIGNVQRGVGLGLSIAKHYINIHGGDISVKNNSGEKGATFTILLPLIQKKMSLKKRIEGIHDRKDFELKTSASQAKVALRQRLRSYIDQDYMQRPLQVLSELHPLSVFSSFRKEHRGKGMGRSDLGNYRKIRPKSIRFGKYSDYRRLGGSAV